MKKLKYFSKGLFLALILAAGQISFGQKDKVDDDKPFLPPPPPPVLSETELANNNATIGFYPNPCTETLNVTLANGELNEQDELTIYSLTGKRVWRGTINYQGSIDVSQLNVGIYIINYRGMSYKFQKV